MNYRDWYCRATSDPGQVDHTAFRRAYAATEHFPPLPLDDEEEALDAAMTRGEWGRAAALLDVLLPRGYARARLHGHAVTVYRALDDPRATHDEEEYAVLDALGLQPVDQSVQRVDGRMLDRMGVLPRSEPSAEPADVYFDATGAFESLGRVCDEAATDRVDSEARADGA